MNPSFRCLILGVVTLASASCAHQSPTTPTARPITRLREIPVIDGRLGETCYQRCALLADFKVASDPAATAPHTSAWLQWSPAGLWFAFAADDRTIVAAPPSPDEHAVDAQDRVELFLWPANAESYYCLEIAPDGALHDYAARLYRQFDDGWSAHGARFAARRHPDGYAVEGFIPVAALRAMGVRSWKVGTGFHLGLFRADFRPGAPDDPTWITWVEPGLPKPDFHVRATFAPVALSR